MESYEKEYKEALERAKKLQENSNGMILKKWLWNIFPELRESEDEKIRKRLIDFFEDWHKNRSHCWGIAVTDILAWLEKQGEQKPTDNDMVEALRTEYEKGRADAIAEMQVAWSEEDENKIDTIISVYRPSPKLVKWLKSLKQRYTWKPSDAQMVALKKAIRQLDLGLSRVLNTLYNDLDKLTKE